MIQTLLLTMVVAMATGQKVVFPRSGNPKAALLIIDVQDCFLSGGSLAVTNGNDVIPVINRIRDQFGDRISLVAISQDWHPKGHISFASSHVNSSVLDIVQLTYLSNGSICLPTHDPNFASRFPMTVPCDGHEPYKTLAQTLWPDHCIQNVNTGPTSSKLADTLRVDPDDVIIRKGIIKKLDSYSAFYDNGQFGHTDLHQILQSNDITHVFIMGLATDYCVYYTSLDAHELGYETYTVLDATRGVAQDTVQQATSDMDAKGIHLINSDSMWDVFREIFMVGAAPLNAMCLSALVIGLLFSFAWRS